MTLKEEIEIPDQLSEQPLLTLGTLGTIQEGVESSISSENSVQSLEKAEEISNKDTLLAINEKENAYKAEKTSKFHILDDDEEETEQEEEYCEETHPNVDQGWAWIVLVSIFFIFILNSGTATTGIYFSKMLQEFGHTRSYTAWMGSLMNAFFMLIGPISSIFIQKYGCRASMIGGAILSTFGYVLSSLAQSLPFLFFSYGIVVASGMNFIYSGQVIALAQYFHKRHAIATSVAMIGIGVGLFLLVPILELSMEEYGWRGCFLINAGFSLNIVVFAALVFPLKATWKKTNTGESPSKEQEFGSSCIDGLSGNLSKPRTKIHQHNIMSRSFSSLKLSVGAGYLSTSIASLNDSCKHGIRSNDHSFCSRGSHAIGVRSNQVSFCHSNCGEIGNHQRHPSFSSRGSYYGIQSLMSNPHSFSIKNSQIDLQHMHHSHDYLSRELDIEHAIKSKRYFHLPNVRDSPNLYKEYNPIQDEQKQTSKCNALWRKLYISFRNAIGECNAALLSDGSFWLVICTVFFSTLSTVKLFVVYKDLCSHLGVVDSYSVAMSAIGIGDVCGRLLIGVITSLKNFPLNPTICYAIVNFVSAFGMGVHLFVHSAVGINGAAALFGLTYGAQNILFAVVLCALFGREKLVLVFGYALFFAGLGSLLGAPIDGYIVDRTGNYVGVIAISVACTSLSGITILICYFINRKKGT